MTAVRHRITAGLIIGAGLGFGSLVATSEAAHASTAAAPAVQTAAHKAVAKNPYPGGYGARGYYNRYRPRYYNRGFYNRGFYPRYSTYCDPCGYSDPCAYSDPCC